MFTVPQKRVQVKPHNKRGAYIYALHKEGKTAPQIAEDPRVIEMSGGYILTRERIRQLLAEEKQKAPIKVL